MCISIITRKVDKNIVREGEKQNEHTIVLLCALRTVNQACLPKIQKHNFSNYTRRAFADNTIITVFKITTRG